MSQAAVQENPVVMFRHQVESREREFAAALPAHIPVERFTRVILTAVNKNPKLLHADRATLFSSAMMAAADGLLCDGREAALVIYRTKKKDLNGNDRWIEAVQYLPMVAGILKKCRNSGELSTIAARVVYGGDRFRNWIDNDGEHIEYEAGANQDRNIVLCSFAMAKLKDGAVEVEVLKPVDIEKIRAVSRAKDNGPWVDWWEEMAKKSAIKRLSKRLPLNTDLDDLMRRDDSLYDFDAAKEEAQKTQGKSLASRLDVLAQVPVAVETAEGEAQPEQQEQSSQGQENTPIESSAAGATPPSTAGNEAAPVAGTTPEPATEAGYVGHVTEWLGKMTDAAELETRWKSEKALRNRCDLGPQTFDRLYNAIKTRAEELKKAKG